MKFFLFLLFFMFFMFNQSYGEYFNQPLYTDKGLGNILIKQENEITDILRGNDVGLNIVLNYMKTLIFTEGYVSIEQEKLYQTTISSLSEKDRYNIDNILKSILRENKREIKIIDIRALDYFLPIDISHNGEK